ncbi:integrase catalytic domain-containing protein [Nephila pilipes]|uniref:Integrase catalytic domain-containing protein n=1 Tax=Nephila pilipes TaxID=299642 RepID=A0A8X6R3W1_NEPPI|nr:integrase catalytic domain-containing protein [Nephila pilipes]
MWAETSHPINEGIISTEKCGKSFSLINNSPVIASIFSRLSSYNKIIRIVGWILRFKQNLKTVKECRRKGCLTIFEMNEAEKRIVQLIQEESFTEESLKGLKTLNDLRDEESILRIKTKLTEETDLRNFRYPMLLPGKHREIESIVAISATRDKILTNIFPLILRLSVSEDE